MMPVSEFLRKVTSRDSVNHTHQLMLFRNEKVGASESRQRLVHMYKSVLKMSVNIASFSRRVVDQNMLLSALTVDPGTL